MGLGVGVDEPIPPSTGLVVGLGVGLLDIDDSVGVGLGDGLGLGVSAALGVSVGVAVGVGVGVTLDGVRVDGVEVGEGLGLCCAATRHERLKTIAEIIIVAPIYRSMTSPPDGLVFMCDSAHQDRVVQIGARHGFRELPKRTTPSSPCCAKLYFAELRHWTEGVVKIRYSGT